MPYKRSTHKAIENNLKHNAIFAVLSSDIYRFFHYYHNHVFVKKIHKSIPLLMIDSSLCVLVLLC